jgi:hypothetical protein
MNMIFINKDEVELNNKQLFSNLMDELKLLHP